jgi:hypothetical protein
MCRRIQAVKSPPATKKGLWHLAFGGGCSGWDHVFFFRCRNGHTTAQGGGMNVMLIFPLKAIKIS